MARRKSRWGFWCDLGFTFLLVGSWLVNLGLMVSFLGRTWGRFGASGCRAFIREIWSSGYGDVKVVRLELSGLIMRGAEEKLFGVATDPVETLLRQIGVRRRMKRFGRFFWR